MRARLLLIFILMLALTLAASCARSVPGEKTEMSDDEIRMEQSMLSKYIIILPPDKFFTDDDFLRKFEGATFPLYAGYTAFDSKGCITLVRKNTYPIDYITNLLDRLEESGCRMGAAGYWDDGYHHSLYRKPGEKAYYDNISMRLFCYKQTYRKGGPVEFVAPATLGPSGYFTPDDSYVPKFTKSCVITSNLAETRACLRGLKFDDHISLFITPDTKILPTPWLPEERDVMTKRRAAAQASPVKSTK